MDVRSTEPDKDPRFKERDGVAVIITILRGLSLYSVNLQSTMLMNVSQHRYVWPTVDVLWEALFWLVFIVEAWVVAVYGKEKRNTGCL